MSLNWLLHTDGGLAIRVAAGVVIFAWLAIVDLRRHGRAATRWREYGVLAACAAAAMLYGAINDQIISSISWEYFYYGKELDKVLGPAAPPDMGRLHWEAAKVGVKATWGFGLIFGVVLLMANNPRPGLPRLRNRDLIRLLPMVLLITMVCGAIGGICGYEGYLTQLDSDFVEMVRTNIFRPRRFMCTWGVHLSGYAGGLLGTLLAAARVMRLRGLRRETVSRA